MPPFPVLDTALGGYCYHFFMVSELTESEIRVLGALVEKETTTPEYYPLSLNALVNACNQKSNRDPVMNLDEDAVRQALRSLTDRAMVRSASGDSRVAKFEHRLSELYNFPDLNSFQLRVVVNSISS